MATTTAIWIQPATVIARPYGGRREAHVQIAGGAIKML
jgi:hypothetical protein